MHALIILLIAEVQARYSFASLEVEPDRLIIVAN